MLASPLYPAPPFSTQLLSDDHSQLKPAKDIDAFNSLLPPPIEFVEGSSSGTLAVAEGKYEPINTPKASKVNNLDLHHANSINQYPRQPREQPKTPSISHSAPPKAPPSSPSGAKHSLYNGILDFTWPPGHTVGSGLHNTGNTCFLNSALQCLLHTPPLLRVLQAHSKSDPCRVKNGFCLSCNLRQVMVDSHHRSHSFTPYQITTKLQLIAKHMRKGRQEDSHEFLRYAIDALQKSCLAGYPQKIDHKLAETTWVHKIFGGRLRSRVTCRECKHNSDTFDSMLDISLDIYGSSNLKEAFKKFVAVDYLKGSDKYKCENCKKAVVAEKRFTIHDAPAVLTIHLKRFSPLGRKIGHFIHYDERLPLQPVMSEGQFGPSYSLYGIICHAGGGPNSGHYFAHVKAANGRWFNMNDDMVSPHHSTPLGMKTAYILFYMRDKGQSLDAALSRQSPVVSSVKNGIVAGMKKRKNVDPDEEDLGVKAKRPFIGPLLPSPMPNDVGDNRAAATAALPDPQATTLRKKIAAVAPQPSTALTSLSQYDDDDDDDDSMNSSSGSKTADSKAATSLESSPPPPPSTDSPQSPSSSESTSVPPPSMPTQSTDTSRSHGIDPVSFYASRSNDKKRKSPFGDEHDRNPHSKRHAISPMQTPSPKHIPHGQRRKSSFGGGAVNPYSRLAGNNNLRNSDFGQRPRQYGSKPKRMII
ncbi:cysteine proteinase [Melanogaster broomeanus]|nr:cysteine proteinase [Melanogaster broomeanus]